MTGIKTGGGVQGRQGRRQRRIARRRREIIQAAARVFAEKGYANATTKEIADQADIAEGTLYNYFNGKREILLAVAHEADAPMEAAVLAEDGGDDRAIMTAMFETALNISEEQLPFFRTLLSEAWVDDGIMQEFLSVRLERVVRPLQTFIAARIAAGVFRSVDSTLAAHLAIGMFGAVILPALRGVAPLPSREERHALAEAAVGVFLDGLCVR
jgi:AcrR family transcriptional regulator